MLNIVLSLSVSSCSVLVDESNQLLMDTRASSLPGENCRQNQDYETSVVTIDKCELLQHVYYLSSDQLAGREIGSKGSYLAQQYIIEQLQIAKIKPFKGKYGHDFVHQKNLQALSRS